MRLGVRIGQGYVRLLDEKMRGPDWKVSTDAMASYEEAIKAELGVDVG